VREEADGVVRVARPREIDEPGAVRELGLEGTRRLDGEPTLAYTGRPGQRCEAVLAQSARDLGELGIASDEGRRRRGEIAAPADDRNGGDRRVVREDRSWSRRSSGPGSSPSWSASTRRASWNVSRASAWRPLR
jgi:hypothetical protein